MTSGGLLRRLELTRPCLKPGATRFWLCRTGSHDPFSPIRLIAHIQRPSGVQRVGPARSNWRVLSQVVSRVAQKLRQPGHTEPAVTRLRHIPKRRVESSRSQVKSKRIAVGWRCSTHRSNPCVSHIQCRDDSDNRQPEHNSRLRSQFWRGDSPTESSPCE